MKKLVVVATVVGIAALGGAAAFAQSDDSAAQAAAYAMYRIDTDASVAALLASIDLTAATEDPRTSFDARGHLDFFGAPPGAPAPLTPSTAEAETQADQAIAFIADYGPAFGFHGDGAGLLTTRVNVEVNRTYVRLQQTYIDLEVFGAEMIVQLEPGGVTFVSADIMTDTWKLDTGRTPVTPAITADQAADFARANTDAALLSDSNFEVKGSPYLAIYDPAVVGRSGEPGPVWIVDLYDRIFIDAITGEERYRYPLFADGVEGEGCAASPARPATGVYFGDIAVLLFAATTFMIPIKRRKTM
ncbi:MAG: hypothetical protein AAB353_04410 [Candidatus Hydrogenedentota bacterium]